MSICVLNWARFSSQLVERPHETHKDTFVAPTTAFEWKTIIKSGERTDLSPTFPTCPYFFPFTMFLIDCFLTDSLRTEQSVTISKVSKRPAHASLSPHETHKINGHPVATCTSKPCPSPRLGRPLYVRAQRSPRWVLYRSWPRRIPYTLSYTMPVQILQRDCVLIW